MDRNNQPRKTSTINSLTAALKRSVYIPLIVVGLLVLVVLAFSFRNSSANKSTVINTSTGKKISLEKPQKTETLNKNFAFSLRDSDNKEVSKVQYLLRSVELRNEILVEGQKAYAIGGRVFLVLNLKITNTYEKPVQINARDYIRMTVNNGSEKFAPEIHSDPVEVQAISTKETRVAFSINETDKNLKLFIGEVEGDKQEIKLTIQ